LAVTRGAKRGVKPAAAAPAAPRLSVLTRYSIAALALAFAVSCGLAAGATRVSTDAGVDLLVDLHSQAYRDQAAYVAAFGSDPIVIELEPAPGRQLLTPDHMVGMAGMEGKLSQIHGVKRVYGPGTLVNTFATEVTRRALDICGQEGTAAEQQAQQAAAAAGKSQPDQQTAGQQAFDAAVRACAQRLAAQYPELGLPAVDNPSFYGEILLEPGGQKVRPFWVWALPDTNHALIQVRMDRNATPADVRNVLDQIGAQSKRKELNGLNAHVTGAPALAVSLEDSVRNSLLYLLPLTLAAMLVVCGLALRRWLALLAVPLAALAGLWTAGVAGWVGLPLTPATLAVLPVVLGLTADYVIQALNRLGEQAEADRAARLRRMAAAILPATAIAAVATAGGVLVFAISPVPLVRQFAFCMAIGVVSAWLVSVLAGLPLLALLARRPAVSGLRRWSAVERAGRLPLNAALALAAAGLLGWAAMPFVRPETDPAQLMPAGSQALAEANHVRRAVGLVGEVDLVLRGPDVTNPAVVAWLQKATDRATSSDLRPLAGLALFLTAFNNGTPPDAATTKLILDRIPAYFTGAVVSSDRHLGVSVFAIPQLTSVAQDQALVARLRDAGGGAPAGYRAYPAGLAVLAAGALDALAGQELELNLLALAIVLAVLLAAYRRPLPAVLAVLPTAVAAGWATAILAGLRVASSPLTVLLAGVVVAFATEFSVLWLSRYRSELGAGATPAEAAATASARIGPAIAASSLALVAGFLVLAISPVPMVRDFGLVCGLDLALATAAVLALLPPMARAWLGAETSAPAPPPRPLPPAISRKRRRNRRHHDLNLEIAAGGG
jgi:hydrophobe/amphiphile efflux-3 (HAE3) family protein